MCSISQQCVICILFYLRNIFFVSCTVETMYLYFVYRDLMTTVKLYSDHPNLYSDCDTIQVEHLPEAIYVDPYEITRIENVKSIKVCLSRELSRKLFFNFYEYIFKEICLDSSLEDSTCVFLYILSMTSKAVFHFHNCRQSKFKCNI